MTVSILQIVPTANSDANEIAESLAGAEGAFAAHGVQSRLIGRNLADEDLQGISIVHIHGWGYEAASNAARTARSRDLPYIISPHGFMVEGPIRRLGFFDRIRTRFRDGQLTHRAAVVTGLNEMEVSKLRASRTYKRVEPLPYGWSASNTVPNHSTNERLLLNLDSISSQLAGGTMLLKAMAELGAATDGWKVIFAGVCADDTLKMLEAAVARKGMSDRVTFVTRSNSHKRTEWLGRATALVSSWLHVEFPSSIMQAMAYGVPALCTDQVAMDGMGDAIRICKPDRESLREGLKALLSMSDAERMATSLRAREYATKNLDWSVVAPRFADLYKSVL